jgi:hypothetical protein
METLEWETLELPTRPNGTNALTTIKTASMLQPVQKSGKTLKLEKRQKIVNYNNGSHGTITSLADYRSTNHPKDNQWSIAICYTRSMEIDAIHVPKTDP